MDIRKFYEERKYSRITEEYPSKSEFPLYYEAKSTQFIINEGEMLFIPAGWWHFVFSEDPNPDSRINVAFNFWYETLSNWKEGVSNEDQPQIKKHNIPDIKLDELLEDYELMLHRSKHRYFPPDTLNHRFPELKLEHMTFKEFLITRNPEYYILQNKCSKLDRHAPSFRTRLFKSSIWINFGNVYSLLHYDLKDNLLCQIQGRRRVILFPPEERARLYPMNDYPVELVQYIDSKLSGDVFIRRNSYSITPKICNHVLKLISTEKTTKIQDFFDSYTRETPALNSFLNEQKCSTLKFINPHHFNIVDIRNSVYENIQLDIPFVFLWFMTDATLEIRHLTYDVLQGQLFIFPASFLYPWRVYNGVFVYPNFHRPNPDKSV